MGYMRSRWWWLGLAVMMLDLGCSDESGSRSAQAPAAPQASSSSESPPAHPATSPPIDAPSAGTGDTDRPPEQLIAAGRATYNANCIACHAMDPRQDGALGPAVAGSSRPLIEARVLRAEYPDGYQPKRATRVMVPLPHLEPKLDELAAYLGSLQ